MPTSGTTAAAASAVATGGNVGNIFVPTAQPTSLGITSQGTTAVNFRKGQTVMIQAQSSATSAVDASAAGDIWDAFDAEDGLEPNAVGSGDNMMMYTLPSVMDGLSLIHI